jgi:hypothetical protein
MSDDTSSNCSKVLRSMNFSLELDESIDVMFLSYLFLFNNYMGRLEVKILC